MTKWSNHDISKDGTNFIPNVLNDADFKRDRYLYGRNHPFKGLIYWAVVDPIKHPLYVWKKKGQYDYVDSAKNLNAVVFSDGSLMTAELSPKPFGPVHSDQHGINDAGGNVLDQYLYSFGRKKPQGSPPSVKFTDYVIAKSPNGTTLATLAGAGYAEVIAGLYPMIVNKKKPSTTKTDPDFNLSFLNFIKNAEQGKPQIVAWSLVGPPVADGLIVVAGSKADPMLVVDSLLSIGVSDAVAMDGSDSVMLGEHQESWFAPNDGFKSYYKLVWLEHGLSCGGT